jgi:hypothetical protein
MMNMERVKSLVQQALETERGGVEVYRVALQCAVTPDLRREWIKYLEQTQKHVERVTEVCKAMGIDPAGNDAGREGVRAIGKALVDAIQTARTKRTPSDAELVACECVVFAETKDHLDWELLSEIAGDYDGPGAKELAAAVEAVEEEEDEHLYHSKGWCRELWLQALGMPAVLPPPEEQKDVRTAIDAAKAEQKREKMIDRSVEH